MLTRDHYVAILEKRATEESSIPDNDSLEAANSDYKRNMEDNRQYLGGLFSKADAVESNQTSEAKKLFPSVEGTKQSGNPLMKVAMARQIFFGSIEDTDFQKTASPMHLELAFHAFYGELTKIAQQNLAQVQAKNRAAMQRPAKVWDLSSPASAGGAAARVGGGTSVHAAGGGGILSRAGRALGLMG